MAYCLADSETFKKRLNSYLNEHPIVTYEENLINNFSSNNLSDLYRLFLNLEDSTLDINLYNKLKDIVEKNFSIPIETIFDSIDADTSTVSLSNKHILSLADIIKDFYLFKITPNTIDEKELYQLSVIVNKSFPKLFSNLIKNDNPNEQKFTQDEMLTTINQESLHNLSEEEKENIINQFSSSKLSDLYRLFLDLENTTLDINLYNKLKDILEKNFSIPVETIFDSINTDTPTVSLSNKHTRSLVNIIEDIYLSSIITCTIDEKELYQLSVIVNKNFPSLFSRLIKNNTSNIEKQQKLIQEKILATINHAFLHNSPEAEEENRDIATAIYIVCKKLYPELNIYIPMRIKSLKSSVSNINKETYNAVFSLLPSDLSVGLSNTDIEKQFNLKKANTDFSGFTVVVSNVDDIVYFDPNDPKSSEILALRKNRSYNLSFTHSLENFLQSSEDCYFSNSELLQMKLELLMQLREATYELCTHEYQHTSFSNLLKENLEYYEQETQNPNPIQLADDKTAYMSGLNEIYELLDELKSRVHDKYQAKILDIALSNIFNDELFSDTLKVTHTHVKNVYKKNGFCARYDALTTATGRDIEIQSLSKFRFQASKDGPSDHSALANKNIDISNFFEPVDANCDQEHFKYFLNILDHTPIATRNKLFSTPDSELSSTDRRIKRKIRSAEENVKVKEHYVISNLSIPTSLTMETYLPLFAEYVSPKFSSIGSHHTRFNKSVAQYNKVSLLSSFRSVLLKHDSTSCLAQQLIDKLETIMAEDKNEVSLNGINKRAKERFENSDSSDLEL